MGADLIGWRGCALQQSLGQAGFLGKLKMRAYQRAIESQVPELSRAAVKVTIVVNGNQRQVTYAEVRAQADELARGTAECADCPLARGGPLGCYHFITYPVDASFEELAFKLFTSQLATPDSISDQLYRDIVSKQPATGDWHSRRGPQGPLALRPQPLTHSWGGMFSKKRVDSAQLLASLFITLPSPAHVVGFARFWRELVAFIDAEALAAMNQRGVSLAPDGTIQVAEREQARNPMAMSATMAAHAEAFAAFNSRTIVEIRALSAMMNTVAPRSVTDGWSVYVDA